MAQKCYLIETQVKRCRSLELFSAKIPNETGFQIVQQNIGLQKTQTKHWPAKKFFARLFLRQELDLLFQELNLLNKHFCQELNIFSSFKKFVKAAEK